jgi:DNA-binding CsgD family transcriptional regulator
LPAIAVIVGEAGIGKTALSLAVADEARSRGYLVLSTRPSETEARFSFAGVADLIGGVLPEVLPQLSRPQQRGLEGALALAESDGAPADEGVVAFAFLAVLRRLAAGRRILLTIDDVQWLDTPSQAMLRFALSRLEQQPVAAILTARDEVPSWIHRAAPDSRLTNIRLGPLSVGAIRELLRRRIHAAFPRPTLLRIWETSGGNPLFALELASALLRRGGTMDPGEELPISSTLEELMHERLDRLGREGLEVARIVAALAGPTVGLVEAAAGGGSEVGLSDAVEAGILEVEGDRLRFTHPLLRSAVASASPAMRRSLHARLADLVPGREERARHLALAEQGPNRHVAAAVEEAARNVHARGGAAAAVELAELAVRLTPPADVEDMRRRLLDCADRHRDAGDGRRAITLLEHVYKTEPPGVGRAAIQLRLARALDVVVGPREALPMYRQALTGAEGDDALVAEIQMSIADRVKTTDERNLALAHAELGVQAAARTKNATLRCRALATYGEIHFRLGRGVANTQMEEALALERSLPESPANHAATFALIYQLLWSGDLDRARHLADDLRSRLKAREDSQEELALWYLSVIELRAGNWEPAARHAAESLAIREQYGIVGAQAASEWPAAAIAAHRGQIEEARDRSERGLELAEAEGPRIAQSAHRWVLGFIELSLGDATAALKYLIPGWEIRDGVLLLEPGHRLELADTLEALIAVGELAEAERRINEWEGRAHAVDRSWALAITARCHALVLAARGDFVGAQMGFERALAEHARTQDPFQHARTLLAQGMTLRRARQRGAARRTLEQAIAMFDRLGAPLWAEKTRAELRRIGGRAPSSGELTEAESRVAALVAEGRTNREVASALFVTEHTVEAALTRAYQKLGVRSRAELGARLRHQT